MTSATAHNPFAPPPTPGLLRALGLALLAHGALVVVLTVGVQWRHTSPPVTAEAELWAAVPEQAAPPEATPPPVVAPPEPTPPIARPEPPPPVQTKEVDIATAKEKVRLEKQKQIEREKLEQEALRQEKLKAEKLKKDKEKDKVAQALEAKKLEEIRRKNIQDMLAKAGNGPEGSTGSAAQSKGPSPEYEGRIKALLRRNTTYVDTIVGNPTAEVEVRSSPDGTILSRKLVKSSGVKSWDEAVLNAIDKTEVLPRNENGRVPSPIIIVHSPN
jgi:colicin import membrane protein